MTTFTTIILIVFVAMLVGQFVAAMRRLRTALFPIIPQVGTFVNRQNKQKIIINLSRNSSF